MLTVLPKVEPANFRPSEFQGAHNIEYNYRKYSWDLLQKRFAASTRMRLRSPAKATPSYVIVDQNIFFLTTIMQMLYSILELY
jgi:hypothetical protein